MVDRLWPCIAAMPSAQQKAALDSDWTIFVDIVFRSFHLP
jgi:hypothetical protein